MPDATPVDGLGTDDGTFSSIVQAFARHRIGTEQRIARLAELPSELPDGLVANADGVIEFECQSCGNWTEWPADIEDFDSDGNANVCGGSPRCSP